MKLLVTFLALLLAGPVLAQPRVATPPPAADSSLEFVANRGQWPAVVQYRAAVPGGHLYLEPTALRYVLLQALPHPGHGRPDRAGRAPTATKAAIRGHQLRVQLVGAQAAGLAAAQATGEVRHYLHGADPGGWARAVPGYRQVRYQQPWPGVALRFYENTTHHLEYDFELSAGTDPARVRLRYEGASRLTLTADGQLHVKTTVAELTELHPSAYQLDPGSGARKQVPCAYVLDEKAGEVSFQLGTYDPGRPLVIDPTVVFSTYSGATGSNWGFTATYDAAGNLYSGGIVLDDGTALPSFPTTPGAFQTTFGAIVDIALIKYNPDVNGPAARVWATYLGGSGVDLPSSLVVNAQGELLVLGSTGSVNYPTTPGAGQRTFGGGVAVAPFGYNGQPYDMPTGSDIVVSRLAADGSTLQASTYLGGSRNDGVAAYDALSDARQLPQNYGDALRGDILTDAAGNVYLASVTASPNFPTTADGFGPLPRGGASDAVVVKLPATLGAPTWSGRLGGSAADAAYSLQLDPAGNVYVAGGTLSRDLPGTTGGYQPAPAGDIDGFVVRLAADGRSVQRATYLGTKAYDQTYFVQLGADGGVYLLGQTLGSWPVSAGVYSNPGSRQFIQKLSPDLDASLLSTVFGSGRATIDLSPTAFLVDQCDRVYACGWGGMVNQFPYFYPGYVTQNGYTHGLPTTPNAVRTTPDSPAAGSDFYLIQLAPNFSRLEYGTYYGDPNPNSEGDHVDGGTSRFDPRGVVYAAVCSCFNYNGFPVPPGANTYSATNGAAGVGGFYACNNAAFKIDFKPTMASVGAARTLCVTSPALVLSGTPAGGIWSGPGVSGSVATGFIFTPSPARSGTQTLTYTVPAATVACTSTAQLLVTVEVPAAATALPPVCASATPVPLTGGTPAGGTWSGPGVSGSVATGFVFTPSLVLAGTQTLIYTVTSTGACGAGSNRAQVQVVVEVPAAAAPLSPVCASAGPLPLTGGTPTGGVWSGPGVSGSVATGFVFTPSLALVGTQTLTYTFAGLGTCSPTAQTRVTVEAPATAPTLPPTCAEAGPIPLTGATPAGGVWSGPGVSGSVAAGFVFTPTDALAGSQTLTYTISSTQVCGAGSNRAQTQVLVLGSLPLTAALVPSPCPTAAVAPYPVRFRQPATLPAAIRLSWDFGDNTTASGLEVTHTYQQPGVYYPRVQASYADGRCSRTLALPPITVQEQLVPNIIIPGSATLNSAFRPRLSGCPPRLQIFSRWGRQVYENAAYQGTWAAEGQAAGLYYYLLTPPDGSPALKGWVEVVK